MKALLMVPAALLVATAAAAMPPPLERGSDVYDTPLDLAGAWRLAVTEDPTLRAEHARRDAAVEVRAQALGALLPQVGISAYREDVRADGDRIGLTPDGGIGMVTTRTDSDTDFVGVTARQPIVAVDRWIGLNQANLVRDAADLELALAREALALRVAGAYFGVLAARDALDVASTHVASVRRFNEQIRHRHEAGVVANTDVQEAQAALDAAVADEIDARHRVRVTEQALANVTGVRPGAMRAISTGLEATMPEPAEDAWWLERARTVSTPVLLAQAGTDVARREIQRRRAAHYPTVDVVAGRARTDRSSTNPFEAMDIEATTVRVELNMPLFAGGAIRSRVRQAAAEHREAGYRLDDVRRTMEFEARDAWLGVDAAIQRIRARDQAQRSAQAALASAEAGVVQGMRTTVDVLDAQRQVRQARAAAVQARVDYVMAVLALRAATGLLDDDAILVVNGWLE